MKVWTDLQDILGNVTGKIQVSADADNPEIVRLEVEQFSPAVTIDIHVKCASLIAAIRRVAR
jgi:hypothetical protein